MLRNPKTRRGHLLIVVAALFYGTVVVGGEFFINKGLSLFEIALYPILLMTVAVLPVVLGWPQYRIPKKLLPFFLVYGLIGAFAEFGQFVGLIFRVPVAVVALVLYTQPLWTVVLSAVLLGERITKRKMLAVLLAFAGVAVLSLGSWTLDVVHPFTGLLACLCASVFISLWVIWGRKSGIHEQHFVTTTFGWGAFTVLWLIVLWPLLWVVVDNVEVTRFTVSFPIQYFGYLCLFAIVGGIIPSFCFFRGLRIVEASVAGIILLLEPLSAAALAALLFGQSVDASIVLGGSLILMSNYVISDDPAQLETSDPAGTLESGDTSAKREKTMTSSIRKIAKWPAGLRLRKTLKNHAGWIGRIAWSPNGDALASGSDDRAICVWNPANGELVRKIEGHSDTVFSVAWSHDGKLLASSSDDETVIIWNPVTGQQVQKLTGHSSGVVHVAWLRDDKNVVSGGGDKNIRIWDVSSGETVETLKGHNGWVRQLSLSPDGGTLASASYDGTVRLWDLTKKTCSAVLEGHEDRVHSVVWSPDGRLLASASADSSIRLWDSKGTFLRKVDGHAAAVYDLAFSRDGSCLASKSLDNSFKIWRTDDWTCVASLPEESVATDFGGLSFHPERSTLATLGDYDTVIRIWDVEPNKLLNASTETAFYTSAKVVLVGESNVGKSCLALRLAEDRYEEQATTHGMRFWVLSPQQLNPVAANPEDEHRDIVLWDMGGQDEYRLIHQIFFHDTTIALMLFDPTRGRTAIEEVEGWNRRLEKQLHGRRAIKLLVGTKVDNRGTIVDQALIDRLVIDCGFAGYFAVSAKAGTGIADFRKALSHAIDWTVLTKTAGPEVFHQVYSEIEKARVGGEAVLSVLDLTNRLVKNGVKISQEALDEALDQLALQGVIATTTLTSGDRALVLRIDEVERYAGSVILAARANPRGIPAIEERTISSSQMIFPRIDGEERLPWLQERATLECVIQLLIEHDICLRHEGLLVFPSLFLPTESGEELSAPRGVALHYDFTGAIDNIYASLVAKLCLSSQFGRYRLWENRAEWEIGDQGACGLRKTSYKTGVGQIELYFADQVDAKRRELFLIFVEDHLRQHGVTITETIQITCHCGRPFEDDAVRARLAGGHLDILCSVCETRNRISEGALKVRSSDPSAEKSLIGLKTVIEQRRRVQVENAIDVFRHPQSAGPIHILHLSDLHMSADSEMDPQTMFVQLAADLRDHPDLEIKALDYLFVTGDLTTCASPDEFEKAYQLISRIIDEFGLNAARCVIVPGNHDVDWNESVYEWKSKRMVDPDELQDGTYIEQDLGILVRDDKRYPRRFKNFSDQFYMFLRQEEYPLAFDQQAIPFFFPESRIQLLALNSCWEIDEFFPTRSSIYTKALSQGLAAADEQIKLKDGSVHPEVLRLAIWHHPVTGNDKIEDDAFLDRLRHANFKLCLHGHVHEERSDLVAYTDPERQLYVAGAGSFGAPASQRPEAVPRLYNVLEIPVERQEIKVHTRCLRKATGAWDAWAFWTTATRQARQTFYRIKLAPKPNPEPFSAS